MKDSRRVHRVLTTEQSVAAPPVTIFPLLCPVREYEWIGPWRCELLHSHSGVAELDCVFRTSFEPEGEDTWVVSRYEPAARIEFVRTNAHRVMRYAIHLTDSGDGSTYLRWTQHITALDEEGDALATGLDPSAFAAQVAVLCRLLEHYVVHGVMLAVGEVVPGRKAGGS